MSDISTKDNRFSYKEKPLKSPKKTCNSVDKIQSDSRLNEIPEKYREDYILVQEILADDERAWEYFVKKSQNFLFYTIKKVIGKTNIDHNTKQKAYELTEDLFLDFYEHLLKKDKRLLRRYKANSKLSSYLYVCLSNFIYDFFKSRKWKNIINEYSASEMSSYVNDDSDDDMNTSEIMDKFSSKDERDSFNPEKELYKKEISQIIDELVSTLSENEQLCFNLLFVDGLKPSEASLILGISSFEVSQLKYRIKEKLKKLGKKKLTVFLDDA